MPNLFFSSFQTLINHAKKWKHPTIILENGEKMSWHRSDIHIFACNQNSHVKLITGSPTWEANIVPKHWSIWFTSILLIVSDFIKITCINVRIKRSEVLTTSRKRTANSVKLYLGKTRRLIFPDTCQYTIFPPLKRAQFIFKPIPKHSYRITTMNEKI